MANAGLVASYVSHNMGAPLMRARLTLATILSSLAWLSTAALAAPADVDGDWIGGFEGYDGPVFITAHFDTHGDALSGLMGIPTRDDRRIELQHVTANSGTLSFELPSRGGSLQFEGSRKDRRVSGRVRQNGAARSFELIKLEPVDAEAMNAVSGDYVLSPGR